MKGIERKGHLFKLKRYSSLILIFYTIVRNITDLIVIYGVINLIDTDIGSKLMPLLAKLFWDVCGLFSFTFSMWLVIIFARSSIARVRLPLYFMDVFIFIFSLSPHFLRRWKPTSPKLSHTTWFRIQQNLCYSDFFKVPPKTNGGQKTQNLRHFSCQVTNN